MPEQARHDTAPIALAAVEAEISSSFRRSLVTIRVSGTIIQRHGMGRTRVCRSRRGLGALGPVHSCHSHMGSPMNLSQWRLRHNTALSDPVPVEDAQ
jgi:hypothetical protein